MSEELLLRYPERLLLSSPGQTPHTAQRPDPQMGPLKAHGSPPPHPLCCFPVSPS